MDLANDVMQAITHSIKLHRGAKTVEDIVGVYNDIIQLSHRLNATIVEYESFVAQEFNEGAPDEERVLYLVIDNSKEEL